MKMNNSGAHSLRFNILGPIEAWNGSHPLRLGGTIQERVLTMLLLEPGKIIPVSRLVEAAWDNEPPSSAGHQVRKAISDLRQRIPKQGEVIYTAGPGYRIRIDDDELDLAEFRNWLRSSRRASDEGDIGRAAELLQQGLNLWRGPILAHQGGKVITAAAIAWDERHLAAKEQLFDLRLQLGEGSEIISDLREEITAHPLRENLRAHLMVALYRCGRQAEALDEFRDVRELLAEQLGIDPSVRLKKLHEDILRESPTLSAPSATTSVGGSSRQSELTSPTPIRTSLPYSLADFTGRSEELDRIRQLAQKPNCGTRIVAIDGMGGSGKTSLAVHAAHQLAKHYPDGQVYIDLQGFTPDKDALSAEAALDRLLRDIGLDSVQIPNGLEAKAGTWRAALAGRKILILLDNAANSAQVQPLLPGSTECLVLVTSRMRLIDIDGASWVSLGAMSTEESRTLLIRVLGQERVAAEPIAAAELADLCVRLPLALRLATARLRNRPRWSLEYLVDRLRNDERRIAELSSEMRSVTNTIDMSYQVLSSSQREAFQLLSLHPSNDIDLASAAALLGTDAHAAEELLEHLLDMQLLQQHKAGTYSFHDLVRCFAHEVRRGHDPLRLREGIVRLLDYYVAASDNVSRVMFPGRRSFGHPLNLPEVVLPEVSDNCSALAWLGDHHQSVIGAIFLADREGLAWHAMLLSRNILCYLTTRGFHRQFLEIGEYAVDSARRIGQVDYLGANLSNLGIAYWKVGQFDRGIQVCSESLEISRAQDDRLSEAHVTGVFGLLTAHAGRYDLARPYLMRSIELKREFAMVQAEAKSLADMAMLDIHVGRLEEAIVWATESLERHRRGGTMPVDALVYLANAHFCLNNLDQAKQAIEQALTLCDTEQPTEMTSLALAYAAAIWDQVGEADRSESYARRALHLANANNSAIWQVSVWNVLAFRQLRLGAPHEARALFEKALQLASQITFRFEEVRAHRGLSLAAAQLGLPEVAVRHQRHADQLWEHLPHEARSCV
ncbi:AfsR/SARP family transcriptional regulator [Natronoglycomyces albus]|uniref:Tetratricopeptide repeat protein n=1 Tax=Natronoglycomyces albus TaxID=2811108 RepID=A0A895XG49_9ACTN|nr:BTAD domain-containing putative transcriptional regulator [Natronoglycomyces albus]QSB04841.1 tetratricopeptide repeat protein [Natronoglycomyces albus]